MAAVSSHSTHKLYPRLAEMSANTIHQIWMEGEEHLKEKPDFYKNMKTMQQMHDNNYCLWSADMIKQLIFDEYPDLLATYESYPHYIMQIHLARYIILDYYGGFYIDIDCIPKQSLYDLLVYQDRCHSHLPLVCKDTDELKKTIRSNKKFINNHFLYIPYPHHPLTEILLQEAPKVCKRKPLEPHLTWIMRSVGPYFLTWCIKKYKKNTQKEVNNKKYKPMIHDLVRDHSHSQQHLKWDNVSQILSRSELKQKVHTQDVVNMINAETLDYFFVHSEHNEWLTDKWLKELKMHKQVKIKSGQIAVVAVCVGILVILL